MAQPPRKRWLDEDAASSSEQPARKRWFEETPLEEEEGHGDPGDDPNNSETDEDDQPTAGQQLVEYLLDLYLIRSLSAQDFCISMWHAYAAGVQEAKPYRLKPGRSSGHYQRLLNTKLDVFQKADLLYDLEIPVYDEANRGVHQLKTIPPTRPSQHRCHQRCATNWMKQSKGEN